MDLLKGLVAQRGDFLLYKAGFPNDFWGTCEETFLAKQGKRVYTIGPERRVCTIEASDPEKVLRRKEGFCDDGVYFIGESFWNPNPHIQGEHMSKHLAAKLSSLPCFEAFLVIFCQDICSYFCLVCGGRVLLAHGPTDLNLSYLNNFNKFLVFSIFSNDVLKTRDMLNCVKHICFQKNV